MSKNSVFDQKADAIINYIRNVPECTSELFMRTGIYIYTELIQMTKEMKADHYLTSSGKIESCKSIVHAFTKSKDHWTSLKETLDFIVSNDEFKSLALCGEEILQ